MTVYYAHTDENGTLENGQLLIDHLTSVAGMAREFARPLGAGEWGYWIGMLHDAGKASDAFQRRLLGVHEKVDHSTGGAKLAVERFPNCGIMLAYPIAGHHGGMPNWIKGINRTPLKERLGDAKTSQFRDGFLSMVELGDESDLLSQGALPNCLAYQTLDLKQRLFALYLTEQMLFSSLVDADYLDTEAVMTPCNSEARHSKAKSLEELGQMLESHMVNLASRAPATEVNEVRAKVLAQCIRAADDDPGLFSLEVPTGGGKTLAVMSFAIRHALCNGQKRVIFAIPFTSIVEQTADVFKAIFGSENVLEHHSGYDFGDSRTEGECVSPDAMRERLMAENWDAPIIVTTNVQLFESLFSNKPSRCRKVHNVADSIVILDEVQTLPDELLRPTLAMIQSLAGYAGTSVVLCTATQPNLDDCWPFGSRPKPIIDDSGGTLFVPLHGRVHYDCERIKDPMELDELADLIAGNDQVLCVVSSQDGARRTHEAVCDVLGSSQGVFHLSARMIPEHRSRQIKRIRELLAEGKPCKVVSTQVIEAGVDVDFPLVLREAAGIDSIIQAAGRCNREGKFAGGGRVIVFVCPQITKTSSKPNWLEQMRRVGIETVDIVTAKGQDPFGRESVRMFFDRRYGLRQGYGQDGLDSRGIYQSLVGNPGKAGDAANQHFNFETYADAYKIIADDGIQVFIPWGDGGLALLKRVESGETSSILRRALQRYTVTVPPWAMGKYGDYLRRVGPFMTLENRAGSLRLYSDDIGLLEVGEGEIDPLVF